MPMILLAPLLARKFEKKNLFIIGIFLSALTAALRFFIPPGNFILMIVFGLPGGFATGLSLAFVGPLSMQNNDYHEWKFGKRVEGAVASASSFIRKFILALSRGLPALIFALIGFVEGNVVQSPEATQGLHIIFSWGVSAFYIIAGLLMIFLYKLTDKQYDKIVAELATRKTGE